MTRVAQSRIGCCLRLVVLGSATLAAQPASEVEELRQVVKAQREEIRQQQEQLNAIEQRLEVLLREISGPADSGVVKSPPDPEVRETPAWFERFNFRGYAQIRTNRLATTNSQLVCEICDHSIGANQNAFIRRARFVLSGNLSDRISFYFQPDFANATGFLNFGEIRDLYTDIWIDKSKRFRMRVGQAKIPYGFEVMQSSGSRILIDRSDAIDSGTPNERDLGAFLFWTPKKIRRRFAELVDAGLRGSGDFGLLAAGVYNGQGANHPEANNNMHAVARITYPWKLKSGQFIETSLQAYMGRYTVTTDQLSPQAQYRPANYADRRVAATFVYYPQPFGIQAEYNIGAGPEYSAQSHSIEDRPLRGGYVQLMLRKKLFGQWFIPFYRYQRYAGGIKVQDDARYTRMHSSEVGVEWQPNPYLEFTTEIDHSDRYTSDAADPDRHEVGTILRLQMQVNY